MTQRRVITIALWIVALSVWSVAARAADSPHATWIKAKCALCHGEDGSGDTPQGRRMQVPDLRSTDVQKRTDSELKDSIEKGHSHMPSFHRALTNDELARLVYYIRSIAPKK